jgi:hypothetical protein
MNNYRLAFTYSFQGGSIKTNYRNMKADNPETAIHLLLKYTPSAIKAWVVTETK